MTRRGFLGLIAAAGAGAALPTLAWLESPAAPAAAFVSEPILLRHFVIIGGKAALSKFRVFSDDECLLSAAVSSNHYVSWFGALVVGGAQSLKVEIEGDATFRAVSSNGRTFVFDGVEVREQRTSL